MQILFVIPGDINLPTGGYRYDRKIIDAWRKSGIKVELMSIEGNFPFPSHQEKENAIAKINNFPKADIAVVDGLLGGAAPEFLKHLSQKLPVTALIHHPLCLENGLDKETAGHLKQTEKQGLKHTNAIITTSPQTSRTVANLFNYNPSKITSVLPGVERGIISNGSDSETINLLCVGSIIERKGHKDLLEALSSLKHLNWKLDCIGSTQFDKSLYANLQSRVTQEELSQKITFHGDVSEQALEAAYSSADIFVLPSLFEGYGMAYAEALVRGIPVIGTIAGAIPETVPENCGILVEPSNIPALSSVIETMITDKKLRNNYRNNAIAAEPNFPTWESSADKFAGILKETI